MLRPFAELGQHRHTASGYVLGRRIEQRAMVGERDIVEVKIVVVGIEGAPAAILALQADVHSRPRSIAAGSACRQRRAAPGPSPSPPPRCRRRPGNTDLHIGMPNRQAALAAGSRPSRPRRRAPAAACSHCRPAARARRGLRADFKQSVTGQSGIPHRRNAGLAVGFVAAL